MEPTLELVQQAIRLAWTTGDLRHKLQRPQHQPYDLFYKPKLSKRDVWIAGRRCKKSTLLLTIHAETCIRNPGGQTAFVAPVEKGLSVYMAPIIRNVFSDCPIDLQPEYSEKHNHLLFKHLDSRIVFNGSNMQQYKYMRGQKMLLGTVDEMATVDNLVAAVDDVLFPATWDSNGRIILAGTPPPVPSPDDPVMQYVSAAQRDGYYWHGSVYDAGYTNEKIAEALRETSQGAIGEAESFKIVKLCDPANGYSIQQIYELAEKIGIGKSALTVFLREFMAEFVRDESAVIVPEFDQKPFVKEVVRPVYYDLLYKGSGADLGVSDKTVEIFGYYDFPTAKVIVQKEFWLEGADVRTDNFAVKHHAAVKELAWKQRATFWTDNSNLMLVNDLAAGVKSDKDTTKYMIDPIFITPTEKEDKAEWLNLIRIMFKQGRILIDPSCKLLVATLNGAFWKDEQKKDYGRSKALGHMDALDALIYFIRNLRMSENPFPVNYNIDKGEVYDPNVHIYPLDWDKKPHTEEGRVLDRVFDKGRFRPRTNGHSVMGGL